MSSSPSYFSPKEGGEENGKNRGTFCIFRAMRWRNLIRARNSATQDHDADTWKPKKLLTLVVCLTLLSIVVYFLLGFNYNYTQLPLVTQMKQSKTLVPKPQNTQLPANTSVQPLVSTAQHFPPPTLSHAPFRTPTRPPSPHPPLPHSPQTDFGDSSLPHASTALESIKKPPSTIFKEPPFGHHHDRHLKKILFWNDDYYYKHFGFGFGREPFLVAGCSFNNCITTGDRTRYPIEEVDAVIWHFRANDKSLPEHRSPHTRYVLWLMESPSYLYGDLDEYRSVFNWTFTYRLDSDFLLRYNQVFRRRQPLEPTNRNYAQGKTKLAAWFVSHCSTDSGRITLVRTLQQWIPVDVFGACGPLVCPRELASDCYSVLNATYKFYFSFENSLCRDYITEKFFNILRLDVVPVVYGLGNYSAQAPPHSYIDALSFPSASALADYLLYLHHNDTAYNEYFRWKRFHKLFDFWALMSQEYCALCERLHTDTSTKTYDIYKWYVEEAHCKTKDTPDIRDFINSASRVGTVNAAWGFVAFCLFLCAFVGPRCNSFSGETLLLV